MNWGHISNIQTSFKVIISLFDIVYKSSMTLRNTDAVITNRRADMTWKSMNACYFHHCRP